MPQELIETVPHSPAHVKSGSLRDAGARCTAHELAETTRVRLPKEHVWCCWVVMGSREPTPCLLFSCSVSVQQLNTNYMLTIYQQYTLTMY